MGRKEAKTREIESIKKGLTYACGELTSAFDQTRRACEKEKTF